MIPGANIDRKGDHYRTLWSAQSYRGQLNDTLPRVIEGHINTGMELMHRYIAILTITNCINHIINSIVSPSHPFSLFFIISNWLVLSLSLISQIGYGIFSYFLLHFILYHFTCINIIFIIIKIMRFTSSFKCLKMNHSLEANPHI